MAARTLNRLTDLAIRKTAEPGWYADGGGLYLRIDKRTAAKAWVFVFFLAGKRMEMGLGPLADVSLADARAAREVNRKLVRDGLNPIEARRQDRVTRATPQEVITFAVWAAEIAPVIAPKAAKARAAWLRMTTQWVGAMKDKPIGSITTEDVLASLKPYWKSRPESGRRMRMRIEAVLDAAKAKGLIADPWANPARWKGHLQHLLEKRETAVRHHAALPYDEVSDFFGQLTKRDHMGAYALAFTILTAARTSEVLGAKWGEIDLAEKVWTVPKGRMKAGREHRVPLPKAAIDVLDKVRHPDGVKPADWVFPSLFRPGRPLSTAAMERVLDEMKVRGRATVHGFRSTFRDWAGDTTNFANETVEAALAHVVGDETERAYRRTDALDKRRRLMVAWAAYLGRSAAGRVIEMRRARRTKFSAPSLPR